MSQVFHAARSDSSVVRASAPISDSTLVASLKRSSNLALATL